MKLINIQTSNSAREFHILNWSWIFEWNMRRPTDSVGLPVMKLSMISCANISLRYFARLKIVRKETPNSIINRVIERIFGK